MTLFLTLLEQATEARTRKRRSKRVSGRGRGGAIALACSQFSLGSRSPLLPLLHPAFYRLRVPSEHGGSLPHVRLGHVEEPAYHSCRYHKVAPRHVAPLRVPPDRPTDPTARAPETNERRGSRVARRVELGSPTHRSISASPRSRSSHLSLSLSLTLGPPPRSQELSREMVAGWF